jgi:hypothetical protein
MGTLFWLSERSCYGLIDAILLFKALNFFNRSKKAACLPKGFSYVRAGLCIGSIG